MNFLKYPGNKFKFLNIIENKIEKAINIVGNENFIEPFCGSANISINVSNKFNKVFCYDINNHIIDIFNNFAKISFEELSTIYYDIVSQFGNIGKDKIAYYKFRNEIYNSKYFNTLEPNRSILLYYLIRSCMNGLVRFSRKGFNQGFGNGGRNINFTKESLKDLQNSLQNITFDIKSFFDLDEKLFLNKNIIWFLDPPYITTGKSVSYKSTDFEIIKFLKIIQNIKGKVLYTNIQHKLHDEYLKNWNKQVLRKMLNISPSRKTKLNGDIEMLFTNF